MISATSSFEWVGYLGVSDYELIKHLTYTPTRLVVVHTKNVSYVPQLCEVTQQARKLLHRSVSSTCHTTPRHYLLEGLFRKVIYLKVIAKTALI